MKNKIIKFTVLVMVISIPSFLRYKQYNRWLNRPKELPPNWTLLCDNKGHFTPQLPDGSVFKYECIYNTKQEAIDRAWSYVNRDIKREYKDPESDFSGFKPCE